MTEEIRFLLELGENPSDLLFYYLLYKIGGDLLIFTLMSGVLYFVHSLFMSMVRGLDNDVHSEIKKLLKIKPASLNEAQRMLDSINKLL